MKSSNAIITSAADKGDRGYQMYMAWWQIRELDQSGMVEFSSHTVSHNNLSGLSVAQRWTELTQSKAAIEQQVGHPTLQPRYLQHGITKLVANAGFFICRAGAAELRRGRERTASTERRR